LRIRSGFVAWPSIGEFVDPVVGKVVTARGKRLRVLRSKVGIQSAVFQNPFQLPSEDIKTMLLLNHFRASPSKLFAERSVFQQALEGLTKLVRIPRGNEKAIDAVLNEVCYAAARGSNHRLGEGHRFEENESVPFACTRQCKYLSLRVTGRDLFPR